MSCGWIQVPINSYRVYQNLFFKRTQTNNVGFGEHGQSIIKLKEDCGYGSSKENEWMHTLLYLYNVLTVVSSLLLKITVENSFSVSYC